MQTLKVCFTNCCFNRFCIDKSVKVKEGACVVCEKVLSPYEICSVSKIECFTYSERSRLRF